MLSTVAFLTVLILRIFSLKYTASLQVDSALFACRHPNLPVELLITSYNLKDPESINEVCLFGLT